MKRLFPLAVALLALGLSPALAETFSDPTTGITLEAPAGWEKAPASGDTLLVREATKLHCIRTEGEPKRRDI